MDRSASSHFSLPAYSSPLMVETDGTNSDVVLSPSQFLFDEIDPIDLSEDQMWEILGAPEQVRLQGIYAEDHQRHPDVLDDDGDGDDLDIEIDEEDLL